MSNNAILNQRTNEENRGGWPETKSITECQLSGRELTITKKFYEEGNSNKKLFVKIKGRLKNPHELTLECNSGIYTLKPDEEIEIDEFKPHKNGIGYSKIKLQYHPDDNKIQFKEGTVFRDGGNKKCILNGRSLCIWDH